MIVKELMDHGALCVVDLLHAYTYRMSKVLKLPLKIPPSAKIDPDHLQLVTEAWTSEKSTDPYVSAMKAKCILQYCATIFTELEIQLIKNLLDLIFSFATCSCEVKSNTIEDEVVEKIESFNASQNKMESRDKMMISNSDKMTARLRSTSAQHVKSSQNNMVQKSGASQMSSLGLQYQVNI